MPGPEDQNKNQEAQKQNQEAPKQEEIKQEEPQKEEPKQEEPKQEEPQKNQPEFDVEGTKDKWKDDLELLRTEMLNAYLLCDNLELYNLDGELEKVYEGDLSGFRKLNRLLQEDPEAYEALRAHCKDKGGLENILGRLQKNLGIELDNEKFNEYEKQFDAADKEHEQALKAEADEQHRKEVEALEAREKQAREKQEKIDREISKGKKETLLGMLEEHRRKLDERGIFYGIGHKDSAELTEMRQQLDKSIEMLRNPENSLEKEEVRDQLTKTFLAAREYADQKIIKAGMADHPEKFAPTSTLGHNRYMSSLGIMNEIEKCVDRSRIAEAAYNRNCPTIKDIPDENAPDWAEKVRDVTKRSLAAGVLRDMADDQPENGRKPLSMKHLCGKVAVHRIGTQVEKTKTFSLMQETAAMDNKKNAYLGEIMGDKRSWQSVSKSVRHEVQYRRAQAAEKAEQMRKKQLESNKRKEKQQNIVNNKQKKN